MHRVARPASRPSQRAPAHCARSGNRSCPPWLLAGLALALLSTCGPSRADDGPVLRPGDTLFERLDQLVVEDQAETALPVGLDERALSLLDGRGWPITPEQWQPESRLPDLPGPTLAALQALLREQLPAAAAGPLERWSAALPLAARSFPGRPWLRRGERELPGHQAIEGQATSGTRLWLDGPRGVLYVWQIRSAEVLAFGPQPEQTLRVGLTVDPESPLGVAERRVLGGADPARLGQDLRCRVELGAQVRPGLLTRAPSRLTLPGTRLEVDSLELAVGVLDQGLSLASSEAVVRPGDGPGDGITFAVEVADGGLGERIWSRHVTPDEGFVEERIDLSPWTGRTVQLALVTEAGPAGDSTLDHAVWAGLRCAGEPARSPTRPHVVLIDIDTLRADRLGCYGHTRPTSPRLDGWAAAEATVYTDALASANWTLPSTVSLLSGLAVSQHGARVQGRRFPPGTSLASHLAGAGYETLAHVDGGFVGPDYGFDDGFDLFEVRSLKHGEVDSWDPVLERLAARRSERPVFCFLQTYLVHAPYEMDRRFDPEYDGPLAALDELPESFARDVRIGRQALDDRDRAFVEALYDAGVRQMDDLVGDVLERLAQLFEGQPYLVILTSDHGEELFERGLLGHAHSLHGEVLRVPLIVRFPEADRVGVEHRPVSGLDVVPTVLDVVGLPIPALLPGQSLRAPLPERRLRLSAQGSTHAVQFDGWKLMAGSASTVQRPVRLPRLVDLSSDPQERQDLSAERPERVEQLQGRYDDHQERFPELPPHDVAPESLDPATLADLRALGYLGDG